MKRFEKVFLQLMVICIAVAISFAMMCKKDGWHVDEIATLALSNGGIGGYITAYDDAEFGRGAFIRKEILGNSFGEMLGNVKALLSDIAENGLRNFSLRKQYLAYCEGSTPIWKAGSDFAQYLAADGFSLSDVYINQMLDTHPPLYYLFVRAAYAVAGAFGQNTFTLWPAFWVNMLFLAGIFLLFMRIGERYSASEWIGAAAALCFALSTAGLGLATYMRMYMALCFFTLLSLEAHIALWKNGWECTRRIGWQLALSCALAFLTHYYYAIWAVLCAIVCIGFMIAQKKPRSILAYLRRMIRGVLLSLIMWPFSLVHLLLSNRGAEALAGSGLALEGLSAWVPVLLGCFPLAAIVLGALAMLWKQRNGSAVVILTVPAIAYLLVIVCIAPYADLRYAACALAPLCLLAGGLVHGKRQWLCTVLCACLGMSTWACSSVPYSYAGTTELREAYTQTYSGELCVYVTGSAAGFFREMPDFTDYESVLIVSKGELSMLAEDAKLQSADGFVLYVQDSYSQGAIVRAVEDSTGTQMQKLVESHKGLDARVYYMCKMSKD